MRKMNTADWQRVREFAAYTILPFVLAMAGQAIENAVALF
jgi:hypothetical protein